MIITIDHLYKEQKKLREHIRKKHNINEDTAIDKLSLALSVEVGECANEWRKFKFWSNDQEPRWTIKEKCSACGGRGIELLADDSVYPLCNTCHGSGEVTVKQPVLEEYADILAFGLDIGHQIGHKANYHSFQRIQKNTLKQFKEVNKQLVIFDSHYFSYTQYYTLMFNIIMLGLSLGYTWDEIEKAYLKKMGVNHERQHTGY